MAHQVNGTKRFNKPSFWKKSGDVIVRNYYSVPIQWPVRIGMKVGARVQRIFGTRVTFAKWKV